MMVPQGVNEYFVQGLREPAHVQGRNLVIEYRYADGKQERFPALAAELVALKVDVIVSTNTRGDSPPSNRPASSLSCSCFRPGCQRVVTSLARPGDNVTGLSNVFRI